MPPTVDSGGGIHVYARGADGWARRAGFEARLPSEYFGDGLLALSADGSVLAVGTPDEGAGRVRVHARTGDSWSASAELTGRDPHEDRDLGVSVALSADGRVLAAGAPGQRVAGASGAVHVFVRSDSGRWEQAGLLHASSAGEYAELGASVALSADGAVLAAGAPGEVARPGEDEDRMAEGAAYVFVRASDGWTRAARLNAPAPREDARFGATLALSADGSTLAVGAPEEPLGSDDGECFVHGAGRTYLFRRGSSGWAHAQSLASPAPSMGAGFGHGLALGGDGSSLTVAESAGRDGVPRVHHFRGLGRAGGE
jgi:hypothetical protein